MGKRPGAIRRRLSTIADGVASRLWPVPLAAVIAAVLIGVALPQVDRAIDSSLSDGVGALLFGGGPDAARTVLSAIAGSLITATSLTFSLTVVALQLASSQASPRLLRMFSADGMVHGTLAMFLGTFAYALTVLRTVEDGTDSADPFVPRISVTIASVLTLASVIVLVFFLAHLARQLRVETMLRDVHREASRTLAVLSDDHPGAATLAPELPDHRRRIFASGSGFLTGVDRDRLVEIGAEEDVVVREVRPVGSAVVEGTPLVEWWRRGHSDRTSRHDNDVEERIADCFGAAYERTPAQDVGFGLRQLADVAAKALSPGVNDPTTAVHALGHIAALLGDVAARAPRPAAYADEAGVARLLPVGDTFDDLVEVGLEQIRRYGAGDPDVAARLFGLLDDLAWRVRTDEQRATIMSQLGRLEASVADASYDEVERARFAFLAERVRATLAV